MAENTLFALDSSLTRGSHPTSNAEPEEAAPLLDLFEHPPSAPVTAAPLRCLAEAALPEEPKPEAAPGLQRRCLQARFVFKCVTSNSEEAESGRNVLRRGDGRCV